MIKNKALYICFLIVPFEYYIAEKVALTRGLVRKKF
jgi:hypothetical protein